MKNFFLFICFISMFMFISCSGQKNSVVNNITQNKIVTYKIFEGSSEKVIEDSKVLETLNQELNNIITNTKDRAKSEVTTKDINALKTNGKVLEISFSEPQILNVSNDSKNIINFTKVFLYEEQNGANGYEFIIEDNDNILGLFCTDVDYIKIFKLI